MSTILFHEPPAERPLPTPRAGNDRLAGIGQRRKLGAWILLAALASFAALAAPFFAGRVYVADDFGIFHLPLRDFYARQLGRGEPFDWMNSLYGGFYVAAEGQLGAYHPLHLVLYRFLPLGAAFDLELLLSYPWMFAGTYLLLRRTIHRRDAALFGALAFTFSGFSLLHFVHPNALAIVAHIPWLLFAIEVALSAVTRSRRAAAECGIALLTASQLLLGYPQYFWFSLLIEVAYAAWRVSSRPIPWRRLLPLAWAAMLGMCIGAIQIVPMIEALADSVRAAPDAEFVNNGSWHLLNLMQLVAPYLLRTRVVGQNTHELGFYAGAAPVLLCAWLVAHRRHWGAHRSLIRAVFVFAGLALLLAAGEFGGIYRLQGWLPLVNRFRFPCRALVLVQFCLAVAAAVSFGILLRRLDQRLVLRGPRAHWPLLMVWLSSVALAMFGPLAWPQHVAGPLAVWCGPLLIGIAAGLIILAERGARGALIGLVVFTAVDLSWYGMSYSVQAHTAELHPFVAEISRPPYGPNARVVVSESSGAPRTGDQMLLAGLTRVDGYAGLEPTKRLDYRRMSALQRAGVGWIFSPATASEDAPRRWMPVEPTAARARLMAQSFSANDSQDHEAPAINTGALDQPFVLPAHGVGTTRVLVDAPARITIEANAPAPRLLATTESFHRGWRAEIDGNPGPVVRVDGDFLGCFVPAGTHRVVFEFRPRSRFVGAMISALGLGLLVGTCCFRLRRAPADALTKSP